MHRPLSLIWIFLTCGLTAVLFTNCDVYSGSGMFESNGEACIDPYACSGDSENRLELRIDGPSLVVYRGSSPPPHDWIDVGGSCNDGDFPQSRIYWRVYNNGVDLTTGVKGNACELGKFHIQVNTQMLSTTTVTLEVELVGIDDQGVEHKNSAQALRRTQIEPVM